MEKIMEFIDKIQETFAKIGESGVFQAIFGALKDLLTLQEKEDSAAIVDVIKDLFG